MLSVNQHTCLGPYEVTCHYRRFPTSFLSSCFLTRGPASVSLLCLQAFLHHSGSLLPPSDAILQCGAVTFESNVSLLHLHWCMMGVSRKVLEFACPQVRQPWSLFQCSLEGPTPRQDGTLVVLQTSFFVNAFILDFSLSHFPHCFPCASQDSTLESPDCGHLKSLQGWYFF